MFTGRHIATKLWVGDYSMGKDTATFAKEADGIDRIAVLRADVDNLGHAFVAGFENKDHQNRYVTLSRTATLSRQLSLFFKYHINQILADPVYTIDGKKKEQRNVTICYSGGDDVFLIGAWNEVFEAAVDLRNRFSEYTQGTLTLSAGIGLYQPGYPISAAAREVAELESASKHRPGKDAITVFPDGRTHIEKDGQNKVFHINDGTYGWDTFSRKVIGEKYKLLQEFFAISDDRGKNFMYHLLELLRSREEKIQFARYVYILARLEPDQEAPEIQQQNYRKFSEKMYRWYQEEEDSIQLRTAMQLYAYLTREEE
jgi:CRISPR-associated protein Csm1